MNETKLNRTLLNRSVLNSTRLNATGIARKAKESVEDRVMKSLVLWYDLKRQGATNESMAADPRIIDHSGNGHHATCHNFAWAGMSGMGGYVANYLTFAEFLTNGNRGNGSVSGEKITITSANVTDNLIESDGVAAHKIRVTGLTGTGITLRYGNIGTSYTYITEDGTHELPDMTGKKDMGYSLSVAVESCGITIEQLPLYPNALVSDGVDDYAIANMAQKTDFTFIIGKDLIATPIINNQIFGTGSNGQGCVNYSYLNRWRLELFNQDNNIEKYMSHIDVITPSSFNGHPIVKGDVVNARNVIRFFGHGMKYMRLAFYSFLLFDRTLTAEEIEWVKQNMIGGNGQ